MSVKLMLDEARQIHDELHIDIWYPRCDENPIKSIVIGLMDVRAADNIKVTYDFDRDGWKIEQASVFEWVFTDKVCDPGWKEVAFVQAWSSDKDGDK
jgi:hypothetical protein